MKFPIDPAYTPIEEYPTGMLLDILRNHRQQYESLTAHICYIVSILEERYESPDRQ